MRFGLDLRVWSTRDGGEKKKDSQDGGKNVHVRNRVFRSGNGNHHSSSSNQQHDREQRRRATNDTQGEETVRGATKKHKGRRANRISHQSRSKSTTSRTCRNGNDVERTTSPHRSRQPGRLRRVQAKRPGRVLERRGEPPLFRARHNKELSPCQHSKVALTRQVSEADTVGRAPPPPPPPPPARGAGPPAPPPPARGGGGAPPPPRPPTKKNKKKKKPRENAPQGGGGARSARGP